MARSLNSNRVSVAVPRHRPGRLPRRPPREVPPHRCRVLAGGSPRRGHTSWLTPQKVVAHRARERAPRMVPGAPRRITKPASGRTAVRCPEGNRASGSENRSPRGPRSTKLQNSRPPERPGCARDSAVPNPEAGTAGGMPIRPSGRNEGDTRVWSRQARQTAVRGGSPTSRPWRRRVIPAACTGAIERPTAKKVPL